MIRSVAPKVLKPSRGFPTNPAVQVVGPALESMNKESQARFTAVLLAVLTVAAFTLAWINYQKERDFQVPSDGVWWVDRDGQLVADRVEPDGPGARAGVKERDKLVAINKVEVNSTPARLRELYRVGPWSKATYSLVRQSVPLDVALVLVPVERSL